MYITSFIIIIVLTRHCDSRRTGPSGRPGHGGEPSGQRQQTMVRGVFEQQQWNRKQTVVDRQQERHFDRVRRDRTDARHRGLRRTVGRALVHRLLGQQQLSVPRG